MQNRLGVGGQIAGCMNAAGPRPYHRQRPRITGKDTVQVWHPKVPEPVHIRFAWHRNPLHNLYNIEKLPAVPFRTDDIDPRN